MVLTLQYGGVTSSPDGRVAVDIWWSRVRITGACHSLLSPLLVIPCSPPMFYLSLAGAVTWWLTQGPSVSMWVSPPTGHTLPPLSGLPAADTDVTRLVPGVTISARSWRGTAQTAGLLTAGAPVTRPRRSPDTSEAFCSFTASQLTPCHVSCT